MEKQKWHNPSDLLRDFEIYLAIGHLGRGEYSREWSRSLRICFWFQFRLDELATQAKQFLHLRCHDTGPEMQAYLLGEFFQFLAEKS